MSETQAQYDFSEAVYLSQRDTHDEAPATANPARLGDATLPAALLGEATERPRMMVGRWPLDPRNCPVAPMDDDPLPADLLAIPQGELRAHERLAEAEARAEAAEADNTRLRAENDLLRAVAAIAEEATDHWDSFNEFGTDSYYAEYERRNTMLGRQMIAAVTTMRARAALGKEGR